MNTEPLSTKLLRYALGVVVLWIGALKFADPTPVVGLLKASLSFLAFPAFVYLLGAVEVIAALWLFSGRSLRWAGLLLAGLFAGTLTIFLIAPAVSYGDKGFPFLTLPGEFLLKDLVLIAVSLSFFLGDRKALRA
ncbi:MAG TPA: DUF417 family protein [Gemmatimonadales bacterium]|jgi:uncharacterized membrane protein YkgB